MKYFIIPLILTAFIIFYGTVESSIDCPMAAEDPQGNEDCTYTKSWLWHSVAVLSGTAFGLPPDGVLTNVAVSPDEAEARNFVPMLVITGIVIVMELRKKGRRIRLNDETAREFR